MSACRLLIGASLAVGCRDACPPERPCPVDGGGAYYVLEPDDPTGETLLFLHGARLDHLEIVKKVDEERFLAEGIRLVFPESEDGRWAVSRGVDAMLEDVTFLATVADTIRADGLADATLALGGHSVGGSMTWFAACYAGATFDTFLASSGGFWEPVPTACDTPVSLRHTHGTADTLVPLAGRTLDDGAVQASIYEGMDLWAAANGCASEPVVRTDPGHTCQVYSDCERPLELCLHDDGHKLLPDWEERAVDWLQAAR